MRTLIAAAFVCASAALVAPALADDSTNDPMSPWFVRAGAAELQNMDGLKLTVGGQPFPGTALHYNHIYSGLVEVGYTFLPSVSGVLSVGWPPAIGVYGGGSLAPVGRMESTTIGPSALTVQYKPFPDGLFGGFFQPYVGAGASYMIIFSTHDAAVQNAKLSNDLAPEVEAGSDFMVARNWGFFAEVKKAFLTTHATGNFPVAPGVLAPISGKVGLDPWVYATGVTFHF
jgi:outer membrane protein